MTNEGHDYILTFGTNHYSRSGESLGQCFAVIPARNYDEACAIVQLLRGRKWCHIYESEDAAGVEEYSLHRVSMESLFLSESLAPRPFDEVYFKKQPVEA